MGLGVMISNVLRKSSVPGLTSITIPSSSLTQRLEMVGGSNMMSVVDYLPQSSLIGKTPSMISLYVIHMSICLNFVHQGLRQYPQWSGWVLTC
jgi:hypothetical protein